MEALFEHTFYIGFAVGFIAMLATMLAHVFREWALAILAAAICAAYMDGGEPHLEATAVLFIKRVTDPPTCCVGLVAGAIVAIVLVLVVSKLTKKPPPHDDQ